VSADGAEASLRTEEKRSVPAHRDPADRNPPAARHHLAQHHRSPSAGGAVVPVAVVAAVRKQDDRGAPPERVERVEKGLAEEARRGRAAAVQEDERPAVRMRRNDADLVQVGVHVPAVQHVVLDPGAARRPVAADQVAHDDVRRDGQHRDHG
jgi:hypothetical protein